MDDRSARRDLALVAVTVVGLSRLLEPPLVWLVAAALLGAMLLGTLQVLADEAAPGQAWFGVPIESLILPSVAAVACLGAIRLVPFGLWLVPGARADLAARRAGRSRSRRGSRRGPTGLTADDRTARPGHDPARRVPRRSPAWPRWCPGGLVQPVGGRRRSPESEPRWSSPPATRSSPSCSAIGRPRCG